MPNWKKLIVSGSDASLNSLNVTNNVTAQSFTGSFSGSFTAPGATTQVVFNNGGTLAASSNFVFSGSNVGIGTASPTEKLHVNGDTRIVGNTYVGGIINAYQGDASIWVLNLGQAFTVKQTTGNVGIGTTSPGAKLQISGGTLDGSALTELGISSGLTTGRLGTFDASSLASISTRGDASSVELAAGSSATYYTGISATANNATLFTGTLRFFTSGSEKVRVTPGGNVVINSITTPYIDDKLYIASGNIILDNNRGYLQYTTGGARATLLALNSSNNLSVGQSNTNNASLLLYGGTGNVTVNAGAIEVARFTTAGNVGIGTTSPSYKLDVTTTSATSPFRLSDTTTAYKSFSVDYASSFTTQLNFGFLGRIEYDGNGGVMDISNTSTQAGSSMMRFIMGTTERMRITDTGNVGIGTTTPTTTLEVNGNVKAVSFTGSFSGSITHAVSASYALSSSYALTSSYAVSASYAVTASHALTASYVNPLNQDLILTGSFIATGGVTASSALINGNLTVIGTASFTYTTASYVNVGASTIILNTDNPAVRFGGINVVDSGSFGTSSTGSLLWDSEKNRWIYSNPSGSTYDGGLLISGPINTTGLGNEQGTTLNALMKGQGDNHITSSGMFEDSSGNVGVGTASPSAKFEVVGNVKATSFTGSFSGSFTAPGSTTQIVYNDNGVLAANSGLVYSGSNVGIGITAPTDKLHIVSSATGNQFGRITATDSTASAAWVAQNDQGDNVVYRVFGSGVSGTQMGSALGRSASLLANLGGSGVFLLGTFSNTNFILGTNNTENMRITTAGFVGIGTTSPGAKLHVAGGEIRVDAGQAITLDTSNTMYLVGASNQLRLYNGGNPVVNITTGGLVGIGTTSPSQILEVQGQAQIGNDSVTSAGLFFARKNSNQAKSHYFLSAQESPTYQWIEGGYWTGENTGVSVANNSGKPYYESYIPAGQVKTFGFINQTTSGSSFTNTAVTASVILYQGGNIALAPTLGDVGIGTTSPESISSTTTLTINGSTGGGAVSFQVGGVRTGLINGNDNYLTVQSYASRPLSLGYNGNNTIVVNTSNNVGIGTTSPGAKLDVETSAAGYAAIIKNTSAGGDYLKMIGDSGNTVFEFGSGGTGGEGFVNIYSDAVQKILFDANGASYFNGGNVGIGTTSPGYKLEVVGAVSASTYYGDGSNLTNIGSGSVAAAGSDGQLQYNNGGSFGGASRLYYNDSTNRVGIGTSSPGYDLDVSGSARVQDRLRVGVVNTGNGVIHQSSDATINPSSSTIVWSVPGSAGICAFIEYYVFNSNTGTSQRAGNIVTTWNSAGTPQITHTETTTPDIGTTALVTFTTSITLGGDPQLVATNTSGDVWYMIMNYRYF
jgi:hypothetical protein